MGAGVNDRRTPRALFERLDAIHHFTLDGAAAHDNALVDRYCTLTGTFIRTGRGWYQQGIEDGLGCQWGSAERVWLNPPYGRGLLAPFVRKAYEAALGGATVVALLPCRTEQPWFHACVWDSERCAPREGVSIEFLPARVHFDGLGAAPFPSMVVTWKR